MVSVLKTSDAILQAKSLDRKVDLLQQAEDEAAYLHIVTHVPEVFTAVYYDYELAPMHVDMLNHARNNRRSLSLVSRGHGKSTILARVYPTLEICTNPNVRIIIIMKTAEDASAYSGILRNDFLENEKLKHDFGIFYNPNAWASGAFNVAQRQINDPHSTVEIFGVGGKYLGHRCDILIFDDIVTEENSWTRDQREKLKNRFETAIQTCPQYMWPLRNPACKWDDSSRNLKVPEGIYWPKDINYERISGGGTRFHPQDLYKKIENDKTYSVFYRDCWADKECTVPTWSAMWTKEKLDAEKQSLGVLSFNKRYRNIALDESELGFKQKWIFGGEEDGEEFPGCLNRNRSWGEGFEKLSLMVGFDPASGSTTKYATFPSFCCVGVDNDEPVEERKRVFVDIFRIQTGFDELIDVLLDGRPAKNIPGFRRLYNYSTAVIEKNGYGTMFIDNDRMRAAQAQGLRVIPHWTQQNRSDPIDGIFTMQGIFKQGLVDIPYKTTADQKKADVLLDQILTFPKGITDYLLSFWFTELQFRQRMSKSRAIFATPGDHYKPGSGIKNPYYLRLKNQR